MSALDDIVNKKASERTSIESCIEITDKFLNSIVTQFEDGDVYTETLATKAAAELAAKDAALAVALAALETVRAHIAGEKRINGNLIYEKVLAALAAANGSEK